MNANGHLNIMRRESARMIAQQANCRMGVVTSYDPNQYAAKVLLQPEGIETGFLPIATTWVGNGWGIVCPPTAGDVVDVHFQEWGKNAGYISLRFYSSVTVPPGPCPSGEFWQLHKSGSFLKFTNDGKVSVNSASDMDFNSAGNINLTATGEINANAGTKLILHGATETSFDAGGTGFVYQPNQIETYTDGVPSNHQGPSPPEVPT